MFIYQNYVFGQLLGKSEVIIGQYYEGLMFIRDFIYMLVIYELLCGGRGD